MGIGAWLGTTWLINVWVGDLGEQKKVLGMTPASDAREKHGAPGGFSGFGAYQVMLSDPMLSFMGQGVSRALFRLIIKTVHDSTALSRRFISLFHFQDSLLRRP